MCCGGTYTWRWTLARWQHKQAFAQAVTSVERPFQIYLKEIRRRVASLPEWAVPWRCSKTCRRRSLCSSGRNVTEEESLMRSRLLTFCVMMRRHGLESLYLWAKDLAEGQGCSVGDGCTDPGGPGGGRRRAGQCVRYNV
jgi:hypothetical protein